MTISSNQDVQNALNTLGVASPLLVVDGAIGALSKAAILAFQRTSALTADGIAGPQTKAALQAALDLQSGATDATWDPNAPVVAVHVAATPATATTAALPAHTLHVVTATGATTAKPLGTPVPAAASKPWTTAEKVGVGATIAAGALGLFMATRK
jgi:peptidoglycan hydrolase-like protein with peptidoglycan-binding domain